jgi:two-component sensor histidine kinase
VLTWPFIGFQSFLFLIITATSAISLFLNFKRRFWISKRVFILVVYLIGTYTTTLLGGDGYYHLGTLLIFAASLILFDTKSEKIEILLGLPVVALTLLIGEFGWFNAPDFSNHEAIEIVRFLNIFSLLVINSILTVFIIRLNDKNESELVNSKSSLESLVAERTSELNDQKIILEVQNKEKEVLLQEVHHRVKNNLQIIVSLINLQMSKTEDEGTTIALSETQGRVLSMSIIHQEMYQTNNFAKVGVRDYILNLIKTTSELHGYDSIRPTVEVEDTFNINLEKAIPFGLIINEIVMNYFKHVANQKGTTFKLSIVSDLKKDVYICRYSDNGCGFKSMDNSNSLGLQLIESLTEQIEGEFRYYNDNGAVYEFTINL